MKLRKYILPQLLLLSLLPSFLLSQTRRDISGTIRDSTTKEALEGVIVHLFSLPDSIIRYQATSNGKGYFSIANIAAGLYLIGFSNANYQPLFIPLQQENTTGLPIHIQAELLKTTNQLQDVVVTSSPPMILKKDTTEYNARSFHTKPNAQTTDLLRKMPGMDIDKSGVLSAMGEAVQRVFIDGKPFFGNDPQLALSTLPPDLVEKIQVFDGWSDQATLTGYDDGVRIKTINIITKKNMRKGVFGKGLTGTGSDQHYETGLSINRFNEGKQLNLVGQLNNTNKAQFSGGSNDFGNLRSPSTTTGVAGINYRDKWSPTTEVYGTYYYSNQKVNPLTLSRTQTYARADTVTDNRQQQQGTQTTVNHRATMSLQKAPDSISLLKIQYDWERVQNNRLNERTNQVNSVPGHLLSQGQSRLDNNNISNRNRLNINYIRSFPKKGRSLNVSMTGMWNTTNGANTTDTRAERYPLPGQAITENIHQQSYNQATDRSYEINAGFTEPLSDHQSIDIRLNKIASGSLKERQTFDFDSTLQAYVPAAATLYNVYETHNEANTVGISYNMGYENIRTRLGGTTQSVHLAGDNRTNGERVRQHFVNFQPYATLNVDLDQRRKMDFSYSGSNAIPSAEQLQDVVDFSDPMAIKRGNPALKPGFNHSFQLVYNSTNAASMRLLNISFNVSVMTNSIANSVISITGPDNLPEGLPENTPAGATYTQPVNLSGNHSFLLNGTYSLPLKYPKSNFTLSVQLEKKQTASLLLDSYKGNSLKNHTQNYNSNLTLKWTSNFLKHLNINFSATSTYALARYSVSPRQNTRYFSQWLQTDATWFNDKGWIAGVELNYDYQGRGQGENLGIPLLNASLAKQLFRDKSGEICLSVNDALDKNQSVFRIIEPTAIRDGQTRTIRRYVLLTFTYNLRKFSQMK